MQTWVQPSLKSVNWSINEELLWEANLLVPIFHCLDHTGMHNENMNIKLSKYSAQSMWLLLYRAGSRKDEDRIIEVYDEGSTNKTLSVECILSSCNDAGPENDRYHVLCRRQCRSVSYRTSAWLRTYGLQETLVELGNIMRVTSVCRLFRAFECHFPLTSLEW